MGLQLKRGRLLGAMAVCAVSGLLVSAPVHARGLNDELAEAERLAASMAEAAKFTVIHMNRASSASSLATAQAEATLSRTSGIEMVSFGRKAIGKIEQVLGSTSLPREAELQGDQAVCYLREAIRHVHHWMLHVHHIKMSDSFRGGIGHVIDGARHARLTGNALVTGQAYLTEMAVRVASEQSIGLAEVRDVRKVKGLPFCGLGEESQHGREIFLDVDDGHEGHETAPANQEEHH